MTRKHVTTEQVINKLRESEVILSQGIPIAQVRKKLGISEQTYYRRRKEYGGLRADQAKKLREVMKENARLKKVVADLPLDNDILRETASGNFQARPSADVRLNMCVRSWWPIMCRRGEPAKC